METIKYRKQGIWKDFVTYKKCTILTNALDSDLECSYERYLKVNFKILNGKPYFLFDILVADIEIFENTTIKLFLVKYFPKYGLIKFKYRRH